jgi:trimeric autotransporter adhesin
MKRKFTFILFAVLMFTVNKSNAQCNAPTGLTVSYVNDVTTFSWDAVPNATEYYFEIDWAGSTWVQGEDQTPVNTYAITGLMQGGDFQWRVRTNCNGLFSVYSNALYSSACLAPFNLSTTSITPNSAVLNWMQSTTINNSNTGFSVSYRLANTNNAWIQLTNIYNNPTATFFNLTGLAANTTYEWRVRRACSFSNSDYVYSQFVTAPVPLVYCIPNGINLTNCNGSINANWINYFKLGSINRTSVSEPSGYAYINASTDLLIGSTNNAGEISVGFSGRASDSRFMIWIDFNRNGSFADVGERLIANAAAASITGTTIKPFSINIPSTVTAGTTRMRVFSIRNAGNVTNPCLTNYLGETEDYNVNLVTTLSRANTDIEGEQNNVLTVNAKVSPNPSKGVFHVQLAKNTSIQYYEIRTMSGNVVEKKYAKTGNLLQVDITTKSNGIYFLKCITMDGKQQLFKLIKN